MSIIIKDIQPLVIVSSFGERVRKGIKEFHPGVDIRVYDKDIDPGATKILPVIAPENIKITEVKLDPRWGHYIKAAPIEPNPLGIVEFRFWHIVPVLGCQPGMVYDRDEIIGRPESGYVPLHCHFETRIDYRGTTPIDPVPYLRALGADVEYKKSQG